jgi:hypothetical protein
LLATVPANCWRCQVVVAGISHVPSHAQLCLATLLGAAVELLISLALTIGQLMLCSGGRWRCVTHVLRRARLCMAMLEQLDLAGRTAELARTFGIDFFSVINRGRCLLSDALVLADGWVWHLLGPGPRPSINGFSIISRGRLFQHAKGALDVWQGHVAVQGDALGMMRRFMSLHKMLRCCLAAELRCLALSAVIPRCGEIHLLPPSAQCCAASTG